MATMFCEHCSNELMLSVYPENPQVMGWRICKLCKCTWHPQTGELIQGSMICFRYRQQWDAAEAAAGILRK